MIYLDYNATTPTHLEVLRTMLPYFNEKFGNPSSIHRAGQDVRRAVEDAREKVAKLLNADAKEIIFTSGGTEANNTVIKGVAFANRDKGNHIITSQIEHHAVLAPCKYLEKMGFEVTYLPVDKYGIVDLDALRKSIKKETILITIMHANNEMGAIQPIEEIAKIAHEHGIYFHTDAVQTVGKLPIDVKKMEIDMLSLSGHKFYGPKGIGALYVRKGVKFHPLLHGGHHEKNRRAGTENVPGIIGLGKACELAMQTMSHEQVKIKNLRDKLEHGILEKISDVFVLGHPEKRMYNTLAVCFKYVEGESILLSLDEYGICASSGSACTSGALEPSHVLLAMGIPHEIAHGSIRFSIGKFTKEEDIDKVIEVLPDIIKRLREISPFT